MLNWLRKLLKIEKVYVLKYQRIRELKKGEMMLITIPDSSIEDLNRLKKDFQEAINKSPKDAVIFTNAKVKVEGIVKKNGVGIHGRKK